MSAILKILCCSVCFLIFSSELFAQRGDGSLYSSYGLGLLGEDNYGQASRLAGTGVGVRSNYFLNTVNPANGTSISAYNFMVDAQVDYRLMNIQTSTEEVLINQTTLSLLSFWFRTSRKSALSLGIMPMSTVDYSFMEKTYFEGNAASFDKSLSAYGNINKVFANFSYDLFPKLSLGLRPYYAFGHINHETYYDTNEITNGTVVDFTMNDRDNYNGYGMDLGLQWSPVKTQKRQVTMGLTYQLPAKLKAQTTTMAYLPTSDSTLYEIEKDSEIIYAGSAVKGGISYQNSKWLIAADYSYKYFDKQQEAYTPSHRMSLGAELLPDFYSLDFIKRMNFSAGLFYDTGYIISEGSTVPVKGASLGLGMPIHGFTRVNISYQYEQKGKISQLSREVTHGITLNFNLGDIWFKKSAYQ